MGAWLAELTETLLFGTLSEIPESTEWEILHVYYTAYPPLDDYIQYIYASINGDERIIYNFDDEEAIFGIVSIPLTLGENFITLRAISGKGTESEILEYQVERTEECNYDNETNSP
jgi:hypothetical protein